jgi:CRP-like cAMP-binding protein
MAKRAPARQKRAMSSEASLLRRNKILAALPHATFNGLAPHLTIIHLAAKQILYDATRPSHCLYFPISSVISLLNVMEDGESVEVATVGNEGFVGVHLVFKGTIPLGRAVVQAAGVAAKLDARRADLTGSVSIHDLLGRYVAVLLNQIFLSSGCNRFHSLTERCARWLLMMHDRADSEAFPFTQDFLAEILGVRRQSIVAVEAILQKAGYIRAQRGRVRILDPKGLASVSCECYKRLRESADQLYH